jgi:hypothetical protein
MDDYGAESQLAGGSKWQSIVVSKSDFKDASGGVMSAGTGIKELPSLQRTG